MIPVRAMLMRGGTSKGMYFLEEDLLAAGVDLDELLPLIMGSPDSRQIDGAGGGNSTTSKVAIVSASDDPDCDIDYLFGQVDTNSMNVDWEPTCGNLLVGVAPFAIERGLVEPASPVTEVRINLVNTGALVTSQVATPHGRVQYEGSTRIGGVSGTASPISVQFEHFAGGSTGSLFPTGRRVDVIDGVEVTAIDAAVCAIIMRAGDFGLTGGEDPAILNANTDILARVEDIRVRAGELMGMGDVSGNVLPKVMLVSSPSSSAHIRSRYLVPHSCHPAHAVSGAICLATAISITGTVAEQVGVVRGDTSAIRIEHPSGEIDVETSFGDDDMPMTASVCRTARKLFDGTVFADVSRLAC